jgi:hypothetical protein
VNDVLGVASEVEVAFLAVVMVDVVDLVASQIFRIVEDFVAVLKGAFEHIRLVERGEFPILRPHRHGERVARRPPLSRS